VALEFRCDSTDGFPENRCGENSNDWNFSPRATVMSTALANDQRTIRRTISAEWDFSPQMGGLPDIHKNIHKVELLSDFSKKMHSGAPSARML
jgi:hypothetical protein